MESANLFHPHSLPLRSFLEKSSRNVPSSMVLRAWLNTPRRSSLIATRTIANRIADLRRSPSDSGMAESKQTDKTERDKEEESKGGDEERVAPPPPEKPLPDDCCGSGCVRCVWDMYYDELEEYNKLYGQK